MATVKELEARLDEMSNIEELKNDLTRQLEEVRALKEELKGAISKAGEPTVIGKVVSPLGSSDMVHYVPKGNVKIELFHDDNRYKDPLFVSINGRNWIIKRGVEVEVPDYVAKFINDQMREERIIIKKAIEEEQEFMNLQKEIGV